MNRIEIKIGGSPLFLGDNFKINFEFVSPLFGGDLIQGSVSYAFNLPRVPQNHQLLGVPYYIENSTDLQTIHAIEFEYGSFFFQGSLKIRSVYQDFIKCNLQIGIGEFAQLLGQKKLKDLALDQITIQPKKPYLIFKLNTSGGTPVNGDVYDLRVVRAGASDIYHRVAYDTDKATTIANLISNINTVRQPAAHVPANTYAQGEVVVDSGTYYEAISAVPASTAITNATYWFNIGNAAAWDSFWTAQSGIYPALYDDPNDDYLITASAGSTTDEIILEDDNLSQIGILDPDNSWNIAAGSTMPNSAQMDLQSQTTDPSSLASVYWDAYRIHMDETTLGAYPVKSHVFFPVYNEGFILEADLPGTTKALSYHQNYFQDTTFDRFSKFRYASKAGANHYSFEFATPFTYVMHILDQLAVLMGVDLDGDFLDHGEIKRVVLFSTVSSEKPFEVTTDGVNIQRFNSQINLSEYMPDVSLNEFLKTLGKFFFTGIIINPATRTLSLKFLSEIVTSSAADDWSEFAEKRHGLEKAKVDLLTFSMTPDGADTYYSEKVVSLDGLNVQTAVANFAALPTATALNDVRKVTNENAYYKTILDESFQLVWAFHSFDFLEYQSSDGSGSDEQEFALGSSSLVMYKGADPNDLTREWLVPRVNQKGNTEVFFQKAPFSLRFLTYQGMQADNGAVLYPLGSSDTVNHAGTTVGKLALRLNGTGGLIDKLGEEWVEFLHSTKGVIKSVWMTPARLHKAITQMDRKIKIDGNLYLIEKIKIQLPITEPAQVFLRTANQTNNVSIDLDPFEEAEE